MFPIFAGNSASTGYNLTRSLRTRASASAYLNRTLSTSGSLRAWTWSAWVKRGALGTAQVLFGWVDLSGGTNFQHVIQLNTSDQIDFYQYNSSLGTYPSRKNTTQVFRDPSAWYHMVYTWDSNNATAEDRARVYINGVRVTAWANNINPTINLDSYINNSLYPLGIGVGRPSGTAYFDGYLTEVNFIDGQALTPSSFGSINTLTGVWQPARYTGTYGTNGFYLPFTDNSALTTSSNVGLGKDFSGNGNYWTTNNISITAGVTYDSMTDVPTLTSATAANFGVVNPIGNGSGTISNGNLRAVTATTLPDVGNFAMQSGKWYWEVTLTVSSNPRVGVYDVGSALPTAAGLGGNAYGWCMLNGPSRTYTNNVTTSYGSFNGTTGDVVMLAYDANTGRLWYGANGTWFASGDPATNANPSQTGVTGKAIVAATASGSGSNTFDYNFGQRPFTYTPPTGYVALNTYNLPTSTILKGNSVMDATLYTGTLLSNAITNAASFKPDLVWLKSRSAATSHKLTDSVRGVTIGLVSNTTAAETTDTQGLTAFGSAGFTVGTNTDYNNLAATYVAWQWQAGQGSSSSNTNGSITSTVSVNASAGFSVVTFTGQTSGVGTVGHGLGVAPSLIIIKARANAYGWPVYHISSGNTNYLVLNTTSENTLDANEWNNTSPTSSVFTLGTNFISYGTAVAYCWTPIAGFSAFGSYTGNGSTDGPFVYLGFRPKYVLIKDITTSGRNWVVIDSARSPYNPEDAVLLPNASDAEASGGGFYLIDMLSNGFKIRTSWAGLNASGNTLIYAAFAENPTKYALAR